MAGPPLALEWRGDLAGSLEILDQTLLPGKVTRLDLESAEQVWEAIRSLRVRGAPLIGVAAAYGVVLGVRSLLAAPAPDLQRAVTQVVRYLGTARPTAVNLFWALSRMQGVALRTEEDGEAFLRRLLEEAHRIRAEDEESCRRIGENGAALIPDGATVLTHCNAGCLATARHGTALSCIYAARAAGKNVRVLADETRPLLQGARLTAWELQAAGVPTTLLCDGMAAAAMRQGRVDLVVVGADRIAANGDVANKIGTYSVALAASHHRIPFYVAAPRSTFDRTLPDGDAIPIEERPAEEVTCGFGTATAPAGIQVWNPAFDVTPAHLVAAIITELGVLHRPDTAGVAAHLAQPGPG